ncbi:unnamed protein product [Aureobasidium uvarum]|uniref:Mei2-like C-terminal RNA recognition motif domain-containing protein n=1 Tax=Aureobasidium uvarum TaxID=2773716 RepID=A0A9N8KQI4_9PEZI|nr:unnamed protein product [Aureobasidium uvarum]
MAFWTFNQPQIVNLQKIEAGIDVRTTIMLRNISNGVDLEDLKIFLDATSEGHYDLSYLRIDFSNNLNAGSSASTLRSLLIAKTLLDTTSLAGGIELVRPKFITNFIQRRVGKGSNMYGSMKKCDVSYATIQGIDCLLAKFRNSVVMEEIPRHRPQLWYSIDSTDLPTIACMLDIEAVGVDSSRSVILLLVVDQALRAGIAACIRHMHVLLLS